MNKEAKILIGLTVATIVALIAGVFFFSNKQSAPVEEAKTYDNTLLLGDNPIVKGATDPKVTIVEFADLECPACAASHSITNQLVAEYPDKIKFVFRHFPLDMHPQAFNAARAAEAANAQGKFWEMHDILYQKQNEWERKNNAVEIFEGYAKELGLNIDEFKKAFSEKSFDARIQSGLTQGTAAGVQGTPNFFINGKKFDGGVLSLPQWKQLLAQYLE